MAKLDTRGFMDGALKGFDTMTRYQDRQDSKARTERLDQENNRRYNESQAFKQDTADRRERLDTESQKRYDAGQGLRDAQLQNTKAQQQSAQDNSALVLQQKKNEASRNWRAENKHLIEQKWIDSINDEVDTDFFDQEGIKGTEQDIRSWDNDKIERLSKAIGYMEEVIAGKRDINSEEMLASFDSIYRSSFEKSIGSKDLSNGKVITAYGVDKISMAADINPEVAGNQPGLLIMGKITYEDGSTALRPVTENRSSDSNDPVKQIPIENVLKDMNQRAKMVRIAAASKQGSKLFGRTGVDADFIQKKQLKYLDKVADLGKEKAKDISKLLDPSPENVAAIEQRYAAEESKLEESFFAQASSDRGDFGKAAIQWAKGDESHLDDNNKTAFLSSLIRKGYNVGEMSPDFLEQKYQDLLVYKQKEWAKSDPNSAENIINNIVNTQQPGGGGNQPGAGNQPGTGNQPELSRSPGSKDNYKRSLSGYVPPEEVQPTARPTFNKQF